MRPLVLLCALASPAAAQRLPEVPVPPGNEPTRAKELLGAALFWEEQVSVDGTVACGTCHLPEAGGSDPRPWIDPDAARHPGVDGVFGTDDDHFGSPGVRRRHVRRGPVRDALFGDDVQVTHRRPRTTIGAAFMTSAFWDARAEDVFHDPDTGEELLPWAAALEVQSLQPIFNDVEMSAEGRTWAHVARELTSARPLALSPEVPARLADWIDGRGYPELFAEAFGNEEISAAHFAMAVATYERTLVPDRAPVLRGGEHLTELELEGFQVFLRSGCAECHHPEEGLFTDQTFHFVGVAPVEADAGLAALTGEPTDEGLFLTPSLLNVGLRGPYFHDGSKATLEEVVEFYDRGGDHGTFRQREILPLRLSDADKAALVAFLRRPLTDPRAAAATGPFERPLLSWEADGRYRPPVRGISGPMDRPLADTVAIVRAGVTRPFEAWLPAAVPGVFDRTSGTLVPVPTEDLARMEFGVPRLVPDDPALVGVAVLASFRPLFAVRGIRSTVTIAVSADL